MPVVHPKVKPGSGMEQQPPDLGYTARDRGHGSRRAARYPHASDHGARPAAWAERGSSRASCTASRPGPCPEWHADAEVTVVANTADDIWVHGLKVCPDLDTVMYTLGDGIDLERGLGPARRDVEREGGAGGVRRGADLVRPRRPRRRHPPGPHPDARRRLPALRGDRGALPALAARACGCCR